MEYYININGFNKSPKLSNYIEFIDLNGWNERTGGGLKRAAAGFPNSIETSSKIVAEKIKNEITNEITNENSSKKITQELPGSTGDPPKKPERKRDYFQQIQGTVNSLTREINNSNQKDKIMSNITKIEALKINLQYIEEPNKTQAKKLIDDFLKTATEKLTTIETANTKNADTKAAADKKNTDNKAADKKNTDNNAVANIKNTDNNAADKKNTDNNAAANKKVQNNYFSEMAGIDNSSVIKKEKTDSSKEKTDSSKKKIDGLFSSQSKEIDNKLNSINSMNNINEITKLESDIKNKINNFGVNKISEEEKEQFKDLIDEFKKDKLEQVENKINEKKEDLAKKQQVPEAKTILEKAKQNLPGFLSTGTNIFTPKKDDHNTDEHKHNTDENKKDDHNTEEHRQEEKTDTTAIKQEVKTKMVEKVKEIEKQSMNINVTNPKNSKQIFYSQILQFFSVDNNGYPLLHPNNNDLTVSEPIYKEGDKDVTITKTSKYISYLSEKLAVIKDKHNNLTPADKDDESLKQFMNTLDKSIKIISKTKDDKKYNIERFNYEILGNYVRALISYIKFLYRQNEK